MVLTCRDNFSTLVCGGGGEMVLILVVLTPGAWGSAWPHDHRENPAGKGVGLPTHPRSPDLHPNLCCVPCPRCQRPILVSAGITITPEEWSLDTGGVE